MWAEQLKVGNARKRSLEKAQNRINMCFMCYFYLLSIKRLLMYVQHTDTNLALQDLFELQLIFERFQRHFNLDLL